MVTTFTELQGSRITKSKQSTSLPIDSEFDLRRFLVLLAALLEERSICRMLLLLYRHRKLVAQLVRSFIEASLAENASELPGEGLFVIVASEECDRFPGLAAPSSSTYTMDVICHKESRAT